MEKTMSVEDKIRRAEEIYARRQGKNIDKSTIQLNGKKKKGQFRRLIKQTFICLLIYLCFLTVKNSEYIFSKEFLADVNRVLSYRTNINEIINNIKNNAIQSFNKFKDQGGIGGADENTINEENLVENQNKIGIENDVQVEAQQEVQNENQQETAQTEEEKEIEEIKSTTSFIKPIEGTISSTFGMRNPTTSTVPKNHTGIDIAANIGTKIKASTSGEVVLASEEGDYGKHLKIQIGNVSIIYAHCNNLYVKQGDQITQGQEIAEVGTTGNSTGPHLHFEIRISEKPIDPQKILEL